MGSVQQTRGSGDGGKDIPGGGKNLLTSTGKERIECFRLEQMVQPPEAYSVLGLGLEDTVGNLQEAWLVR